LEIQLQNPSHADILVGSNVFSVEFLVGLRASQPEMPVLAVPRKPISVQKLQFPDVTVVAKGSYVTFRNCGRFCLIDAKLTLILPFDRWTNRERRPNSTPLLRGESATGRIPALYPLYTLRIPAVCPDTGRLRRVSGGFIADIGPVGEKWGLRPSGTVPKYEKERFRW
jgi:hypothetical protein